MAHVTCRLTAKNRDQLQDPTLGNRVWVTFTLPFTSRQILATPLTFSILSTSSHASQGVPGPSMPHCPSKSAPSRGDHSVQTVLRANPSPHPKRQLGDNIAMRPNKTPLSVLNNRQHTDRTRTPWIGYQEKSRQIGRLV